MLANPNSTFYDTLFETLMKPRQDAPPPQSQLPLRTHAARARAIAAVQSTARHLGFDFVATVQFVTPPPVPAPDSLRLVAKGGRVLDLRPSLRHSFLVGFLQPFLLKGWPLEELRWVEIAPVLRSPPPDRLGPLSESLTAAFHIIARTVEDAPFIAFADVLKTLTQLGTDISAIFGMGRPLLRVGHAGVGGRLLSALGVSRDGVGAVFRAVEEGISAGKEGWGVLKAALHAEGVGEKQMDLAYSFFVDKGKVGRLSQILPPSVKDSAAFKDLEVAVSTAVGIFKCAEDSFVVDPFLSLRGVSDALQAQVTAFQPKMTLTALIS